MVSKYPVRVLFCIATLVSSGCRKAPPALTAPSVPTVTVAKPVTHSVQMYHDYNGYLEPVETVQIRARVKGILKEVKFHEGDDVVAGAELYTIDPREYESTVKRAEADIARAKADLDKASADIAIAEAQFKSANATAERMRRIGASASMEEFDKAVAAAAVAEANKAVAEANKKVAEANASSGKAARETALLSVEYTRIKAPIDGRISRTLVTKGNLVGQTEATLLTTIVRMDKLYVYFDMPERDLVEQLQSRSGSTKPESVPLQLSVATESGFPHVGEIDFQENRVDPGTGTIRVRGQLENPILGQGKERALYPGLFARIRVPIGPRRNLVVIPEEAIMIGQEGNFVYVLVDGKPGPDGQGGEGKVVKKTLISVVPGPPVWRMSMDNTGESTWTLANPTPAPNTPATQSLRAVVAVAKGLEPTDEVIVAGLQKVQPGRPASSELWTIQKPTPNPR